MLAWLDLLALQGLLVALDRLALLALLDLLVPIQQFLVLRGQQVQLEVLAL